MALSLNRKALSVAIFMLVALILSLGLILSVAQQAAA
jgi:hypothetical protein